MQFNNYGEFIAHHRKMKNQDHQRLGQRFVNGYIKHAWPELFYEADDTKAEAVIQRWLNDHSYTYSFPKPIVEGRDI